MVHRSSQIDLRCTRALQPRRNLNVQRRFLTAPAWRKVLRHKLPFQLRRILLWCAQGGARRCARALAGSPEITVDAAVARTVLFKPSAPNGASIPRSSLMMTSVLPSQRGVIKVRVNSRRNILAADVSSRQCVEEWLGVTDLCGIPVSTRIPADPRIQHRIPARCGSCRVSGVPCYRWRPLRCMQCGRLGPATATCRYAKCCRRCGQSHPSTESCGARAHCVNCGYNHAANTPPVVNGKRHARWPLSWPPLRYRFPDELCPPWYKKIIHSRRGHLLAQPRKRMHRPLPVYHAQYQPMHASRPVPVRCHLALIIMHLLLLLLLRFAPRPCRNCRMIPRDAIITSLQLTLQAIEAEFAPRTSGVHFDDSVRLLRRATSCSMQSTMLKRQPSCREPSPDVPFVTSSSYSCGPRGEGLSAVSSAIPWQKIRQLSGGWMPSVEATQTDDGSEAGSVSPVPSPALDAVQLRAGFCDRCSAGQPFVSLYWLWPSLWTSRSLLRRTSWRVN
ncbi:hypothetical protein MRX96_032667 [Rhipicephalus microplus]